MMLLFINMKKKLNWYRDTDMILEKMIDAELKTYNIRMKDIIDSKDWFSKYTFKRSTRSYI